jgi:hypothetical protein
MSIQSVIGRIAEIEGITAPAAPPTAAPAAGGTAAPAATSPATQFSSVLQGAMTAGQAPGASAPVQAAPGTYPHLSGDLDANPELMQRLEALAAQRGEHFTITSGGRSFAEQQRLWDARGSNPYPVARPGTSRHETGRAADVTIGGRAIQTVISASELRAAGLAPLAGDAVHVELP